MSNKINPKRRETPTGTATGNSGTGNTSANTSSSSSSSLSSAGGGDVGMSTDLTSLFECPVCFDYVLPPYYKCSSGHFGVYHVVQSSPAVQPAVVRWPIHQFGYGKGRIECEISL
ncbi:E3 ubiquitin-protein ligase sina [Eumeta japonica]|uniref:E3 ubiquitin-protein ligase sina n=1 Tax=Eumeta variegata TaxID=151549 RepID=A0A4C1TK26_EUMVA|nr:E3 ubiquitin-protein ligase sina [Eumeta japonica]